MKLRGITLMLAVLVCTGFAYIDPGAGLYIWQVIVAGVLGAGYSLRRVFSWLRVQRAGRSEGKSADAEPEDVVAGPR